MALEGPFAIDRLRAKQRGEKTIKPQPVYDSCDHIWVSYDDGHGRYWYECDRCMATASWLPPVKPDAGL